MEKSKVYFMKEISKSELEIMQFLWKNGESTSVDIVKNVGQQIRIGKNDWSKRNVFIPNRNFL